MKTIDNYGRKKISVLTKRARCKYCNGIPSSGYYEYQAKYYYSPSKRKRRRLACDRILDIKDSFIYNGLTLIDNPASVQDFRNHKYSHKFYGRRLENFKCDCGRTTWKIKPSELD